MQTPLIDFTVITPVYNCEKFIGETIESVIKFTQGFTHQYIVVDDGSTDNTPSILQKYKNYISIFQQINSGQSNAINKALSNAKGKYSLIVNADDPLITSDLFLEGKEVLDNNVQVAVTYPDWQIIDERNAVISNRILPNYSVRELVGMSNCLVGPGGIFRTDLALKIGGWSQQYRFVPDFDFWLKFSELGMFHHIPKIQAVWREHSDSISMKHKGLEMSLERIEVIRDYLDRNPNTNSSLKKMAIAHSYLNAAKLSYFDSRIKPKSLLFKGIQEHPRILIEQKTLIVLYVLFHPVSKIILQASKRFKNMFNQIHKNFLSKLSDIIVL
jgi:glycosyltransferase involved in cell wall biosynthesis